ncbi:hypothetical protein [Streptomyces sp. So13.3]|uniref:hypothetical protein n=1 Tax=Streptomyces sp. So13.3 TaxID=2136173 RepID=UPI001FD2F5C4|nr:hypothetical protein [Streptomyces sp. So13.3]
MPLNTEFDWQVQACQGSVCSALTPLADTHVSPMLGAGARGNATRLSFSAGDHVSAQVEVGSGNLLVNTSDLTLPGINGNVGLGAASRQPPMQVLFEQADAQVDVQLSLVSFSSEPKTGTAPTVDTSRSKSPSGR